MPDRGYSAIGIVTVRAFSSAGATVVVPARRPDYAQDELAGIERVEATARPRGLDSVRGFADRLPASHRPIDILLNNAGVMANPEMRVGPGWESQFATNHLGRGAPGAR